MPRVTPPRSPRSETAQAAASGAGSGAGSSLGPSDAPNPDPRSEPAAATQAAALSADSSGGGMEQAEVEMTTLSELGSLAVDALNLFVDNQEPPASAAGAGSDSSKWARAASEADSGPTIFLPSVIEHEDRDLELEEPFAGPTDLEYSGDTEIHPLDSPTAEGHPAPVDEHSLGNTQVKPSPDQDHLVPEETTSASANAPNPADQGGPAPAEEELEEFVPPETLIAQASSTPNSPPLSTNNLFDPLGEDEESSAEDAVDEGIAQRIQEQYDLEAALEESARAAGVEPEPADLGVGEAAATGAGKGERETAPVGGGAVLAPSTSQAERTSPMGKRVSTSVHSLVTPHVRGSAAASTSLTFPRESLVSNTQSGSSMSFVTPTGGRLIQKESFCQSIPSPDGQLSYLSFGNSCTQSTPHYCFLLGLFGALVCIQGFGLGGSMTF